MFTGVVRTIMCTNGIEYNPKMSKGKTPVSVRFTIGIPQIYVHICNIIKRNNVFFNMNWKMAHVSNYPRT